MASHNKVGTDGEELAAVWLATKGYEILHRNWRYSHYEVDIIAKKNKILKFVEVKCRNASPYGGFPEESVTKKKFKSLKQAADEYLFLNPGHKWIQYDVLAITLYKDKEPEFFLLEDVYL
ncbi:MAG: YraN family protein [Chitinophagaceae bacterium]